VNLAPFETLRTLTVTGAIVSAPIHVWAQQAFGEHVYVHSPAGGTDVCCACMFFLHGLADFTHIFGV
jgi:acetoacetyl-CoA synthetase